MQRTRVYLLLLTAVLLSAPVLGMAADADTNSNSNPDDMLREDKPMIEPEVEVNEISEAKIDNEDFEFGAFGGLYSTEDFGSNAVVGGRFAYHITEDFFIEFTAGRTKTRKSNYEEYFYVSLLPNNDRTLKYYDVSFGYNFLPGEAFISSGWAFYTDFYLTGGVGATEFGGDTLFTGVGGVGFRFIATDWMAFHVDMRVHTFKTDVIKQNQFTKNLEFTGSLTFFF